MSEPAGSERKIIVGGDVTMDWNLAHISSGERPSSTWTSDDFTRVCRHRGGAALLADLIDAVAGSLPEQAEATCEVRQVDSPRAAVSTGDPGFHHSYAMWSLFESGKKLPTPDDKPEKVWRVKEFLGLDRSRINLHADASESQSMSGDDSDASLVVLDDADLGFRHAEHLWPAVIREGGNCRWVLLKISRPVAQGPLWEHLLSHFAEKLIVVMTIDDLRRTEVQISRRLSWERTAQDVVWELIHNPRVNGLACCAHTVVSFETAGAILLSQDADSTVSGRLFFEPGILEGTWNDGKQGRMIGYTATLTSAIARQLILNPDSPDVSLGVQTGVAGMRRLYREGYGTYDGNSENTGIAFPVKAVIEEFTNEKQPLIAAAIQDPVRSLRQTEEEAAETAVPGVWTILEDRYSQNLDQLAGQIVLEGLSSALQGVPIGRIGNLVTVDRMEFEALRSIQNLIGEYCSRPQKRPLSIAVFGPPGSGKSFGVEQVANSIRPGEIEVKTFNISQFDSPRELHGALHQVRDVGLKGKLPLVFWDEFDSTLEEKRLGWLRFFLAPMQDGTFQQGEITHPVGRCIFVFAGGTCTRMSEFEQALADEESRKAVKLPDFVSRLKGFLNVMGPNPQRKLKGGDPYYKIRRAILLRSIFERNAPQLFDNPDGKKLLNIDSGVLRAFIQTKEYKHGIRSIESIGAMSNLSHQKSFARSNLPAETQLNLHVDGQEFLALVQEIVLTGEILEKLAQAAHDVYCAGKKRDGWKYGPVRNDEEKIHPLLKPYDDIPEAAKDANRENVKTIPRKLAAAGYVMMPARSNEPALEFPGDDLETLAELEHNLWMDAKLAAGFELGEETPEHPRRNPYLVPWEELPDEIKQIDRDLIEGIPKILEKAGYAVVKLNKPKTDSS